MRYAQTPEPSSRLGLLKNEMRYLFADRQSRSLNEITMQIAKSKRVIGSVGLREVYVFVIRNAREGTIVPEPLPPGSYISPEIARYLLAGVSP